MMKASQYLKVRTELLIALDSLRRLPLREFIDQAEQLGIDPLLRDHDGLPVAIDTAVIEMARCAVDLCSYGPHAPVRKPVASEFGGAAGRERLG